MRNNSNSSGTNSNHAFAFQIYRSPSPSLLSAFPMTVFKFRVLATVENHPEAPGEISDKWMDVDIYHSWCRKGYITRLLTPLPGVLHRQFRLRNMRRSDWHAITPGVPFLAPGDPEDEPRMVVFKDPKDGQWDERHLDEEELGNYDEEQIIRLPSPTPPPEMSPMESECDVICTQECEYSGPVPLSQESDVGKKRFTRNDVPSPMHGLLGNVSPTRLRVFPVLESASSSQLPLSQVSLSASQEELMFPDNRERALYRLGRKRQPHTEWPGTAPLKITKLIPSDFVDEDDEEEHVVLGSQVQGNLGMVMEVCMSGMVAKPDAKAIDMNQEARDAATAARRLGMCPLPRDCDLGTPAPKSAAAASANRTKTRKRRRARQKSQLSTRQPGEKYIDREAPCEVTCGVLDCESGSSSGSSDSSSASGSSSASDAGSEADSDDRAFINDSVSESDSENVGSEMPVKV